MVLYYVFRYLDLWIRWSLSFVSILFYYYGSLVEVFYLYVNFMCFIWYILFYFLILFVILEEMLIFNYSFCIKYSIV